jgi:putative membrane protein
MSITHTFLDFLPAIFLGCPDEDTSLSILPGHRFLQQGKGFEAIILTIIGGSLAILIILIIAPLFIFLLPKFYLFIKEFMFLILSLVSLFMIASESENKLIAFSLFLLSGLLGIATFNLALLKQPLLPLLTGLFGIPTLLMSIKQKTNLPKQKKTWPKLNRIPLIKTFIATLIASPLCSFLPGIGANQAAIIGSEISGKQEEKYFLILIGSVNTIVMGLSFLTLYTINKARTGSAVAISQLLPNFSSKEVVIILVTIFASGILASSIAIFLAKIFSEKITSFNYSKISLIVLIFVILLNILISGFTGLIVLIVATATGLLAILLNIKRTHLMGCLLLPAIIFSL